MNLYERLNVAADATSEAIKKSYRALARKHHPDKPDGDTDTMQEVQHAYSVLSDEDKRAHYDRTGDDNLRPEQDPVDAVLTGLFTEIVKGALEQDFNIVAKAKELLQESLHQANVMLNKAYKQRRTLEKLIKRVECTPEDNFFTMAAGAQLGNAEHAITENKKAIDVTKKCLARLEEYADHHIETRQGYRRTGMPDMGLFENTSEAARRGGFF
tara:strand:+ start:1232 stop:1870 length:639 start_codon:yes stop_codon:yes gene_type:complete